MFIKVQTIPNQIFEEPRLLQEGHLIRMIWALEINLRPTAMFQSSTAKPQKYLNSLDSQKDSKTTRFVTPAGTELLNKPYPFFLVSLGKTMGLEAPSGEKAPELRFSDGSLHFCWKRIA